MEGFAAATLAAVALVYYVVVYTLLFKRRTSWSTIIGSGAGAIPPLIGWVAVTDRVELTPFLLFAIVWLWTPPHFWALAIFRHNDYKLARLGGLPSRGATGWILVFSLLLVVATLLLVPAADLGLLYLGVALLLGIGFLTLAWRLRRADAIHTAQHLYSYSVFYIAVLFGAMIADRLIPFT